MCREQVLRSTDVRTGQSGSEFLATRMATREGIPNSEDHLYVSMYVVDASSSAGTRVDKGPAKSTLRYPAGLISSASSAS